MDYEITEVPQRNRITTPAEHRAILLASMEALLEGRINVPMANALAGLSAEVHKSIRQEWDMRVYAAEHLALHRGRVVLMLGPETDEQEHTDG